MPVTTSLRRQVLQYAGVEDPSVPLIVDFFDWAAGKLWYFDQVGTVQSKRMIGVARYCINELGINHFVIDSLMKCGVKTDRGYDMQVQFVDALSTLAKDTGAHIHLVAHARKPDGAKEKQPPSKYAVKGTSEITDMADNVLVVYAEKEHEDDNRMTLVCDEQRNGAHRPQIILSFESGCLQFKPDPDAPKMYPDDWKHCRWS